MSPLPRPVATQPVRSDAILTGFGVPPKRKLKLQTSAAPAILTDEPTFAEALAHLMALDPPFAAAMAALGAAPTLRRRPPGFEGMAGIVVAQQVSTASANAIFGRLQARLGAIDAAAILGTSDADLKLCGLSAPKIRTLRALAEAVASGVLDFGGLAVAEADAARDQLVLLKGIGPWTADVFLLFCLGHADAWPAGDLALQEAARLALGLEDRPTTKAMLLLGDRWRPLRGVAAHCLWAYYRAARSRAATLDASPSPPARKPRKPGRTS